MIRRPPRSTLTEPRFTYTTLFRSVITDIQTDRGGDSRHVTTTIKGAQFHPDAIVKVSRPNIAEYEPVAWEVVDASTIIATFDFTDAPHGLYDIKVINPDGSESVEPYRFLIERGIQPGIRDRKSTRLNSSH